MTSGFIVTHNLFALGGKSFGEMLANQGGVQKVLASQAKMGSVRRSDVDVFLTKHSIRVRYHKGKQVQDFHAFPHPGIPMEELYQVLKKKLVKPTVKSEVDLPERVKKAAEEGGGPKQPWEIARDWLRAQVPDGKEYWQFNNAARILKPIIGKSAAANITAPLLRQGVIERYRGHGRGAIWRVHRHDLSVLPAETKTVERPDPDALIADLRERETQRAITHQAPHLVEVAVRPTSGATQSQAVDLLTLLKNVKITIMLEVK